MEYCVPETTSHTHNAPKQMRTVKTCPSLLLSKGCGVSINSVSFGPASDVISQELESTPLH